MSVYFEYLDGEIDYSMNDFMNSNRANYSLEEIELAKKRQKKQGGTFLENLEAVSKGERPTKTVGSIASGKTTSGISMPGSALINSVTGSTAQLEEAVARSNQIAKSLEEIDAGFSKSTNDINSMVKDLSSSLEAEYGVKPDPTLEISNEQALAGFAGVSDVVKEKVYGQDEFIKKLVIAFKRPFVSERDNNDALNSIFISGPSYTGKHYALNSLVEELGKRNIIRSKETYTMDLSIYPTTAQESLFLQDLYGALQSKSSVIVFENYEVCHISLLGRLSELVINGECMLADRYVMKNGQLVSVSNVLADNTVGSFEAKGKYLVFVSNKPIDKLAGVMGAPFVNALGDICATDKLGEDAIAKISDNQVEQLIAKGKKQLAFDIEIEDSFKNYAISCTSKGRELKGVIGAYSDALKALAEIRLEKDDIKSNKVMLLAEGDESFVILDDEKISVASQLPGGYNGELEAVKKELDAIVGLGKIKDYVYSLEEYYGVQRLRKEAGLKAGEVNKHMIFTGNPGTGKTTIARIVSRYLKAIGVLSGGQLVEVSRADLVGRYAGHTAPLVNQVVKSAIGGVLFIDEAYSLYRGNDDAFGMEAIDTLVKGIEDNRDDLIVILAGYSNEMGEFLEANSGLKSRFPNIIDFPDYTGEELLSIAKITAASKGYAIDEGAEAPLLDFFNEVQATDAREAGNGRLVRNKIEEAILNQSRRLIAEKDADMSLLIEHDFEFEFK